MRCVLQKPAAEAVDILFVSSHFLGEGGTAAVGASSITVALWGICSVALHGESHEVFFPSSSVGVWWEFIWFLSPNTWERDTILYFEDGPTKGASVPSVPSHISDVSRPHHTSKGRTMRYFLFFCLLEITRADYGVPSSTWGKNTWLKKRGKKS